MNMEMLNIAGITNYLRAFWYCRKGGELAENYIS